MMLKNLVLICSLIGAATLHAQLTPLTRAIRLEDFAEAKKHITPELVNTPDQGQYHPLTYAAYTGNKELVEALLKAGADPNLVEHNGKTALSVAANLGSPEMVTLLQKHGATLPRATNALPVGRAAVLSSCPETLSAVLTLFPGAPLDESWEQPRRNEPDRPGGAFNYALQQGYFDVALVLARKARDLPVTDWQGRNALQMAAAHAPCPVEVVEALLARGMSPVARFPGSGVHIEPITALELAASRGALGKVRAMMARCDIKDDRSSIERAIFVGSAFHRAEVVEFLADALEANLPTPQQWLARYEVKPDASSRERPKDTHNPVRAVELRRLLPNPRPGRLDPGLTGTIAVVASDDLQDAASLLTVGLSKADGITVLERDALKAVLREQSLAEFQAVDSAALHRTLGLIPAGHVVLLSEQRIDRRSFLQLALLHTRSGVVMTRLALPSNPGLEETSEAASLLLESLQRSVAGGGQVAALAITPLKPEVPTEQSVSMARELNTLLPIHAGRTSGCVVLERRQLSYLESEKVLGVQGAYWSSGWVIDGGFRPSGSDGLTLTLRATRAGDGRSEEVERVVQEAELNAGVLGAWKLLAAKISVNVKVVPADEGVQELAILTRHARWLSDARYPEDAIRLVDSCLALGARDQETLRLALELRLAALPILKDDICSHIRHEPRSLEPMKKFPLTRHFDTYLGLAETAVQYTPLNEHRLIATRPDGFYNDYVSQALTELMLFRTLMDDAMIAPEYRSEIRSLDLKIKQLARLYLEVAEGDDSEFATLLSLLGGDLGYCARFAPEIIATLAQRVQSLRDRKVTKDSWKFYRLMGERLEEAVAGNLPSTPWTDAWDGATGALSLFGKDQASDRVERIRRIDAVQAEWSPMSTSKLILPWVDLTGADQPIQPLISSAGSERPPGGVEGYLVRDVARLPGTAEGRRMYGVYRSIHQWASREFSERGLKSYLDPKANGRNDGRISPAGWKALEPVIVDGKPFSKEARAVLDQLMKDPGPVAKEPDPTPPVPKPAPEPAGPALRLATPEIFLPSSTVAGYPGSVLHTAQVALDGDRLWIPASYVAPGQGSATDRLVIPVIHVLDLPTKRIRTITLPKDTPCGQGGWLAPRLKGPTSDRRILLGDTKAYYLALGDESPSKLFSIDRKTHAVSEVKLPLPYILAVPFEVVDDRLYLSVASMERGNMLVAIEGDVVSAPLVSNLRKPARSPLDDPDTWITRLSYQEGKLVVFSRPDQAIRAADRVQTGIIDPAAGTWELVSLDAMKTFERARQDVLDQHLYDRCAVSVGGQNFYPYLHEPGALTFTPNRKLLTQRFGTMLKPFKEGLKSVPVDVREVDRTDFDVRICPPESDRSSTATRWSTANELIRGKKCHVHLLGRWKEQFLVALHHGGTGLPAIWTVAAQDLDRQLGGGSGGKLSSAGKPSRPADSSAGDGSVYIKASNSDARDEFGTAVAMDGLTAVIGAPGEDSQPHGLSKQTVNDLARDSGAAYVFGKDEAGAWSERAMLKSENTDPGDKFGEAVAVSGNMIVVGAPRERSAATGTAPGRTGRRDNSARDAGAAYVFIRDDDGACTQEVYLKASNTEAGDKFGTAVAISENRVVVGAPNEDSQASGTDGDQEDNEGRDSGAAYVFARDASGVWRQEAYLKPSNTPMARYFGCAVAIAGDTIVVGAREERSDAKGVNGKQNSRHWAVESGAAYVFTRSEAGTWSQQAHLKASDTAHNALFGSAVALSEGTIVVGAPSQSQDAGAAHVYAREVSGAWKHQARLSGKKAGPGDRFGGAVAVAGDVVAVGASEEGGDSRTGAAYIFRRDSAGKWSEAKRLTARHPDVRDEFGKAVAVSSTELLVGSPGEDGSAKGIGGDATDNSGGETGAVHRFGLAGSAR